MVEPTPRAGVRIGSAEREAALKALGAHMHAGRLDPDEYGERAAQVSVARYAEELEPIFSDLPGGSTQIPILAGHGAAVPPPNLAGPPGVPAWDNRPIGQAGNRIMAVLPIVSIVLFFLVGAAVGFRWSWMFFLLTPLVGAILYGDRHAGRDHRNHHRNARRSRYR